MPVTFHRNPVSISIVWRSAVLCLCCLFVSWRGAQAESIGVRSLTELIAPADLIARVVIVSDHIDRTATWRTGYRRVAFGRVLDPLRGAYPNQIIRLYHDTGALCPNVSYRRGDDVLIFATQFRRGYHAIWLSTGVMPVTRSMLQHDLFPKGAAYENVRAQVVLLSQSVATRPRRGPR